MWRAGVGRSFARGGRGRKDAAGAEAFRRVTAKRRPETASPAGRLRCPDSGLGISLSLLFLRTVEKKGEDFFFRKLGLYFI